MDTKDKTPPVAAVEEELSAEEKAIHDAERRQREGTTAVSPDSALPKVQSDTQSM